MKRWRGKDSSPVVALLALDHGGGALGFVEGSGPLADALQNGDDGTAFFGKGVFYARGNFVVGFAQDDAVGDERFQRGGENGVGDVAHLRAQLAVTQRAQRGEHADDAGVPLAAEELHAVFQGTANVLFQFALIHIWSSVLF